MKRRKFNRKEMSAAVAIACGSAVSILLGVLLSGVSAYMTLNGALQERHMSIAVCIICSVSMFCGGWIASILSAKTNIWIPASVVAVQGLLLLAAHILMIDEMLSVTWANIIAILVVIATLVIMRFAGSRKGKFKYRKL